MGLMDRLRGKRDEGAAAEVSSAEAAAAVNPSLDLTEPHPAAAPGPSARQQQFSKTFGVAPSEQLYNPYDGAPPHMATCLLPFPIWLQNPSRVGCLPLYGSAAGLGAALQVAVSPAAAAAASACCLHLLLPAACHLPCLLASVPSCCWQALQPRQIA